MPRMPRWRSVALLGAVAGVGRAGAEPTYFVGAESRLALDRWRGTSADPVESTDLRERLTLGVFDLAEGEARLDFRGDLEIGADLGPSPEIQEVLPVDHRARFDLYVARFDFESGPVQILAGRHTLVDEIGYDALDGVTARVAAAPYVGVEASAGLGVRRPWSGFGPDVFTPDGGALPDRAGYVVGGAVYTRDLDLVQARAAYRRQFDAAVQEEQAGVSVDVHPWAPLTLSGGLRWDALFARVSGLRADATVRLSEALSVRGGYAREVPTFSADSIWNAFGAEPWDDVHGGAWWASGPWRVAGDGSVRFFYAGPDDVQAPGATAPVQGSAPGTRAAWEAGARVERAIDDAGDAGVEARFGDGYGGQRHYGDVFAEVPWVFSPGRPPLQVRGRLGAVHFDDEASADPVLQRDGWSGWMLVSALWPATESLTLELAAEEYVSRETPSRFQILGRLVVGEWL
jgi:hypothetical protein